MPHEPLKSIFNIGNIGFNIQYWYTSIQYSVLFYQHSIFIKMEEGVSAGCLAGHCRPRPGAKADKVDHQFINDDNGDYWAMNDDDDNDDDHNDDDDDDDDHQVYSGCRGPSAGGSGAMVICWGCNVWHR